MVDWGSEFSFFSRYSCKNLCKSWHLHLYKAYDHQVWQVGLSKGIDSLPTNDAGISNVMTLKSRDFEHML